MATNSHNRLFSAEIQQMKSRGLAFGNDAAAGNDLQQEILDAINSLKYIEERVDKMMDILGGEDSFEGIKPPDQGPEDRTRRSSAAPRWRRKKRFPRTTSTSFRLTTRYSSAFNLECQ